EERVELVIRDERLVVVEDESVEILQPLAVEVGGIVRVEHVDPVVRENREDFLGPSLRLVESVVAQEENAQAIRRLCLTGELARHECADEGKQDRPHEQGGRSPTNGS